MILWALVGWCIGTVIAENAWRVERWLFPWRFLKKGELAAVFREVYKP